ncbi:MAG: MBL fold metallo-hydrolase [Flavobacterium sp.]|nr:MBL fold metallo-hydrolase [Flavobacterium sp.]
MKKILNPVTIALCKAVKFRLSFTFALLLFTCGIFAQGLPDNEMRTHYIDVGQGNATLLEFSCGAILIDAGAEGPYTQAALIRYIERFFNRRTDLNKTLNLVIVTYAHEDHNAGLKDVFTKFKVLNYIDNGLRKGSGKMNQKWAQDNATSMGIAYASYSYDQAIAVPWKKGITDAIIDPVNCNGTNPEISILSGRFIAVPAGMTRAALDDNGNLHSLVVKVKFGDSSFLFTGDLEDKAMNQVANFYSGTRMLDCDIWEVSHHGSYNGTTTTWLNAVTPKCAFISCGKWDSGKVGARDNYNTYGYGHPRIQALDMLQQAITEKRSPLDSIVAFYGIKEKHKNYKVTQNVYCSAWDCTVVMRAFKNGTYSMVD